MELASFVIIGAAVSLLVQYLKNRFGTENAITLTIVIVLSIVAGTAYYLVKGTSLYVPILNILAFAGAVYTYIFKRLE